MPADNHVAVSDHGGQDAHGQDDGKRGITGGNKGQANNIGLACSPIAIEQRRGAFPVDVPWAVNAAAIHAAPSSCFHNARFSSKHARWLKQTGAPVKSRMEPGRQTRCPPRSQVRVPPTRKRVRPAARLFFVAEPLSSRIPAAAVKNCQGSLSSDSFSMQRSC